MRDFSGLRFLTHHSFYQKIEPALMQRIQLAEVNEAADLHTVNEELRQQHFLPLTFFPSLPLPILAKSRGSFRGRDFARVGRRKGGRRGD